MWNAVVCWKWCGWIQCCPKAGTNSKDINHYLSLPFNCTLMSSLFHFSSCHVVYICYWVASGCLIASLLRQVVVWHSLNLQRGRSFIAELLSVIPNAHYYKRGTYELKKVLIFFFVRDVYWWIWHLCCDMLMRLSLLMQIIEYAKKKDFTSVIVVHTNRREPG